MQNWCPSFAYFAWFCTPSCFVYFPAHPSKIGVLICSLCGLNDFKPSTSTLYLLALYCLILNYGLFRILDTFLATIKALCVSILNNSHEILVCLQWEPFLSEHNCFCFIALDHFACALCSCSPWKQLAAGRRNPLWIVAAVPSNPTSGWMHAWKKYCVSPSSPNSFSPLLLLSIVVSIIVIANSGMTCDALSWCILGNLRPLATFSPLHLIRSKAFLLLTTLLSCGWNIVSHSKWVFLGGPKISFSEPPPIEKSAVLWC